MAAADRTFKTIIERCDSAVRLKYRHEVRNRAKGLLEAEFRLIQQLKFEESLADLVEFGDRLGQESANFHSIGAGGSSIILYLLNFSKVDPVRYRTLFHRLWITSGGQPPCVSFVVLPDDERRWHDIPRPQCVSMHPMMALEAVPELIRQRLPQVSLQANRKAVFTAIQRGNTDDIFQLDNESVRSLLRRIPILGIQSLARVTALWQISHSHPEVSDEFLKGLGERANVQATRGDVEQRNGLTTSILFQETIMQRLHREAHLPWDESYRFIQTAAKQKSHLFEDPCPGTASGLSTINEQSLRQLSTASQWAVCRAHHLANAITTYHAAYYRTLFRSDFEAALEQVSCWDLST